NTYYAVTPKRLMLRSGFWGTDFASFDLSQIANLEVTVNPIENAHGVGTIRFYSNSITSNGGRTVLGRFIGISNPYEVYKLIRQAVDTRLPAVA
ncbi:MAG TPA: PH domain-containing protein, partial [Gemmatimonadaceae bacterium]|nr:PH domain-containing protein [Gemmatimonadaceae bacterium]